MGSVQQAFLRAAQHGRACLVAFGLGASQAAVAHMLNGQGADHIMHGWFLKALEQDRQGAADLALEGCPSEAAAQLAVWLAFTGISMQELCRYKRLCMLAIGPGRQARLVQRLVEGNCWQ